MDLTRTMGTTRAGRTRTGVTAHTLDITRTRIGAVIRTVVTAVQRRLGQLGYYHGVIDGVIGPQTRGAIASFESRNGLAVDGSISRPLLDQLGLA